MTSLARRASGRRFQQAGRSALLVLAFLLFFGAIVAALWAASSKPSMPSIADTSAGSDPNLPETIATLSGPVDRHLVADDCKRRNMWACRDLFADLYEGGRTKEAMTLLRSMNVALASIPAKLRDAQQLDQVFDGTKAMIAANGNTKEMLPGEIAILGIGTRQIEQDAADRFARIRPTRYSNVPRQPADALPPQLNVERSPGTVQLTNITKNHLVTTVFGDFAGQDPVSRRPREFQCYWVDPTTLAKVGRERIALAPGQRRTLRPDCDAALTAEERGLAFIVFDGELRRWVFLSAGY